MFLCTPVPSINMIQIWLSRLARAYLKLKSLNYKICRTKKDPRATGYCMQSMQKLQAFEIWSKPTYLRKFNIQKWTPNTDISIRRQKHKFWSIFRCGWQGRQTIVTWWNLDKCKKWDKKNCSHWNAKKRNQLNVTYVAEKCKIQAALISYFTRSINNAMKSINVNSFR